MTTAARGGGRRGEERPRAVRVQRGKADACRYAYLCQKYFGKKYRKILGCKKK